MSDNEEVEKDLISTRDWIAIHAMQGLLSNSNVDIQYTNFGESAYQIADAMLAEREKSK